jgi:hypothetical protein
MLVAMHSHLDQIVGNQNCDQTKSSHNQGEMERSNDQTKYGPTSSSCVISPKVAKLDSSCFNGIGGSQNSSKDCKSLRLTCRIKISKSGQVWSQKYKRF